MNPVEIEAAVSDLAAMEFDGNEFPFAFLRAFGNKETTLQRLRSGLSNKSDVGGVLQTNNIHVGVAPAGKVSATLSALRASPATIKAKVQFILATDGVEFEAEDIESGETIACAYTDFPNHFGVFLPLAGITTVKPIRDSAFDIRATSRLNRLYLELLKDNPEWGTAERRHDMNHFMARLIFCFFAEDTDIFSNKGLFTNTVSTMSEKSSSNTHQVMSEVFRSMNTKHEDRTAANMPRWALPFPYVNGGLFSGSVGVPRFSKIARSYLIHIGGLEWTRINPDIFGSMIQAVTDDEERGALGLHYTSVPNILKVLNPLFLDDLRAKLEEAGTNARMLLNLRKRIGRIRVFDPACGSGNFLVIAYKQMRELENLINERRGESGRATDIPLTNFRGIEIRDFAAEIARLALIIAEFQSDVLYRGQQEALKEFLPLDSQNWITCANALHLDWAGVCGAADSPDVHLSGDELFDTPCDQATVSFESSAGELYACGNPPYQGSVSQSSSQKDDMRRIFAARLKRYKDLDYVAAFVQKAAEFNRITGASSAFVATNSITQGEQVSMLWPLVFREGNVIRFAHSSFLWNNLASRKAAVTCVIVGLSHHYSGERLLFGDTSVRTVTNISPYLVATDSVIVTKRALPLSTLKPMQSGNKPTDGGQLVLSTAEKNSLVAGDPRIAHFVRRYLGSKEIINGSLRYCIWVEDADKADAYGIDDLRSRFREIRTVRSASIGAQANENANTPHRFVFAPHVSGVSIAVPNASSERRPYLPCALFDGSTVISNLASVTYGAPLWTLALIASRLHLVWIGTVCGKLKTDFRYSNTLGWHTFPIPPLTEKNRSDLTRCAEDILLAREAHFPATLADLYDPNTMPADVRVAHERNDEILERIYIGRRFRNDTERLEKLFGLYTKMMSKPGIPTKRKVKSKAS